VRPSSRTPEGSPVHCPLCGAESRIELSDPPGDSVCPICGCHLWGFGDPAEQEVRASLQMMEEAKAKIQSNVNAFTEIVTSSTSLPAVGNALVECLTTSLAAYGAMFWIKRRKRWWRRRWHLVSCIGEIDSTEFIASVVASGESSMCEQVREAKTVLLIGVPLIKAGELCGVIEVVQRADSPPATRRGYLRFVSQMASLVAETKALPP
jgi:hypothetical protein